jgi:hypothetical protein
VVHLDLATAKAVAHRHTATVNDLILDLVAGGLRALLQSRGEPVAELVPRAAVAVSLRTPAESDRPGNRSGVIVVPLPLGEPDPTVRLAVIHGEAVTAKRDQYAGSSSRLLVWLARSGLMRWYTRPQRLTTSSRAT